MALTSARCDQCGQTDTHPKWHYGVETYHHDCAPVRVLEDNPPAGALATRDLALSGVRGDDLHAHLAKLRTKGK